MAELRFTIKLTQSIWPRYWGNRSSDNDEPNVGYVAAMEIEDDRRISDGAERHFNFSYLRFMPLAFFKHNKNEFKYTD